MSRACVRAGQHARTRFCMRRCRHGCARPLTHARARVQVRKLHRDAEAEGSGARRIMCLSSCILHCRAVPCRIVSCRDLSCRIVSCRVVSCHAVSCHAVSCYFVSCRVVSWRGVAWRGVPCCAVPRCALPCLLPRMCACVCGRFREDPLRRARSRPDRRDACAQTRVWACAHTCVQRFVPFGPVPSGAASPGQMWSERRLEPPSLHPCEHAHVPSHARTPRPPARWATVKRQGNSSRRLRRPGRRSTRLGR